MNKIRRCAVLLLVAISLTEGYLLYSQKAAVTPPQEGFQSSPRVQGILSMVDTMDNEVVVSFKIPGLEAKSLRIIVNDVWILVSCRAKALQQFVRILPVPANADAAKHRIVAEDEGLKIIFEKRDDPTLKF